MTLVTPEEMLENLDFTCPRCQAECQKINAVEPDLGYISKVDGTFVGPLCQHCWDEIPENEKMKRKIPDTVFTVIVHSDGEGASITSDGISIPFLRKATPYDVVSACNKIIQDIEEALFSVKIAQRTAQIVSAQQKSSKLVVPR